MLVTRFVSFPISDCDLGLHFMSNDLIQKGLDLLRTNGLILSMGRDGDLSIADCYDIHGKLVLTVCGSSRKAALCELIEEIRHKKPGFLNK